MKVRLIDADALKEVLCLDDLIKLKAGIDGRIIDKLIDSTPTVDAVPVVRCKDCQWSVPATNAKGQDGCKCRLERYPVGEMYWWLEPDWFCADGERREQNDEV